jgi:hypothetical protein
MIEIVSTGILFQNSLPAALPLRAQLDHGLHRGDRGVALARRH